MTKKIYFPLISLALVLATMPSQAQKTRTEAEALSIANDFFPKSRGSENPEQKLVYTDRDSVTNHPYYYVFNRGNEQGWVIVCANGDTKTILGYSDTGHFDINDASPDLKLWMKDYSNQLRERDKTPENILKEFDQREANKPISKGSTTFAKEVKPLLGKIEYSQYFPYNLMTPEINGSHCVTGCIPTAMAMIMCYWKYPKTPTGKTHSYNLNGKTVSCVYNTSYDWDNMLPKYKNVQSTDVQNKAIAKLMSDVGIAYETGYSLAGSGADQVKRYQYIIDCFDYDPNAIVYTNYDHPEADFLYFLKREISSKRPILMAGSGHGFVIDGYDANGLFHVNWGWHGSSNGFYAINNLCPVNNPGHSYKGMLTFIGGIQPNLGIGRHVWLLRLENMEHPDTATLGQRTTFHIIKLMNKTTLKTGGTVGMALYSNGKFVKILGEGGYGEVGPRAWRPNVWVGVEWPKDLKSGNYQVVAMFKATGDNRWAPINNRSFNSYDITVSGNTVKLTPNKKYTFVDREDVVASLLQASNDQTPDVDGQTPDEGEDVFPGGDEEENVTPIDVDEDYVIPDEGDDEDEVDPDNGDDDDEENVCPNKNDDDDEENTCPNKNDDDEDDVTPDNGDDDEEDVTPDNGDDDEEDVTPNNGNDDEEDVTPDNGDDDEEDVTPDNGDDDEENVTPDNGNDDEDDVTPDNGDDDEEDVTPDNGDDDEEDVTPDNGDDDEENSTPDDDDDDDEKVVANPFEEAEFEGRNIVDEMYGEDIEKYIHPEDYDEDDVTPNEDDNDDDDITPDESDDEEEVTPDNEDNEEDVTPDDEDDEEDVTPDDEDDEDVSPSDDEDEEDTASDDEDDEDTSSDDEDE